jgi:hypothetical protein
MNNILQQLQSIQIALLNLADSYEEEVDEISQWVDFDGKDILIWSHLENLLIAATHETSSTLAFYIQDITTLVSFIAFRKQFSNLSSALLQIAIDQTDMRRDDLMEIEKSYPLEIIRERWRKQYWEKSYEKVSSHISRH